MPTYPFRLARRRPLTAAGLVVLLAAAAALGGWAYARHQWRAARAAQDAGRPKEATDRLAVPLLVWRWDPDVHVTAARAARLGGDLPAAEAHLNRALKLSGGATEPVQLEFLLLRVQTGEVDEVAPVLIDAAEKGHPDAPLIMETLAVAYMNKLRYKPAYACLSRWIELKPDSAKAYQFRGWVQERLNHHKPAMEDYRKAMDLDPDLIPVRLRVAEMLLEDKQAPEALPHLERLYRQAPDDPLVQARLGVCRFLQGQTAEARRLMEAAAPRLPNDPMLQINLARLDLQDGRGAEAEARLRAVVGADPSDSEALYALAAAVRVQGRDAESDEILKEYERVRAEVERTHQLLREAVDSPTARAEDYAEIGERLLQAKQEDRGLYWLYEALERDPDLQRAHRVLAAYYEQKGDAAKAAGHRSRLRGPAANPPPSRP